MKSFIQKDLYIYKLCRRLCIHEKNRTVYQLFPGGNIHLFINYNKLDHVINKDS